MKKPNNLSARGGKPTDMHQIRRAENTMIKVRWAGVLFGLFQVLTFYRPYPSRGILFTALGLVSLLAAGNIAIKIASRRISSTSAAEQLSFWSLCLDSVAILGFVFVYTFDPAVVIWALIYLIPLEGALRFQRRGAIAAMAIAAVFYLLREVYGAEAFGNPFYPTSITFRMGIGFLIATVAGSMAYNLTSDRKKLEEANELHESILDVLGHLGEGLVITDRKKIVYANAALQEMTGYSYDELISMYTLLDMVPPGERARIIEKMQFATPEQGDLFETALIHRNGRRVELEVAFQAIDDPENPRIVALVRDITKRKEAESKLRISQEQLQEAQHVAKMGSWEWDLESETTQWSEEMFRILDLDPKKTHPEFDSLIFQVHPQDRPEMRNVLQQAIKSHEPFNSYFRLLNKDGEIREFEWRGEIRSYDGKATKMLGTVQDVTERRRAERIIEEGYRREKETSERLRESDAMKSDFLSTVAHELRTPVTTVSGFVRTLDSRWQHFEEEQRRDFLSRITKATVKLGRLVDELLDFSRLERGKMPITIENRLLAHEIIAVKESLSDVLQDRRLEINVPHEISVMADREALRRILENLLVNAVKFSPPRSPISIMAESEGGDVIIRVRDHGIGLPAAELERVFDRFYRVHRGNTTPPGTGIGLAIVKELVELQGGRVWATSMPEGGSTFAFTLKRPGLIVTEGSRESLLGQKRT